MQKPSWKQLASSRTSPIEAARIKNVSVGEALRRISNINEMAGWPRVETAERSWLQLAHVGTPAFIAARLMNCTRTQAIHALNVVRPYSDLPVEPRLECGLAKEAAEVHGMKYGPVEIGRVKSGAMLGGHEVNEDKNRAGKPKEKLDGLRIDGRFEGRAYAGTYTVNSDAVQRGEVAQVFG